MPLLLVAAAATWQPARGDERTDCPPTAIGRMAAAGLVVGSLTGFFGVGGGFLMVPVLTLWLGVGFRRAVGTSLVIITITAAAALTSHLLAGAELDVPVTATLSAATATGGLAGVATARHLPQRALRQGFALVVVTIAVFLLVDTLLLGGPPQAS